MDYQFNVEDHPPYRERVKKWIYIYLSFFVFIIVSCGITGHWIFGAIIAITFFALFYFPLVEKQKFYIQHLFVKNDTLYITYTVKNEEKSISGSITDFKLKIGGRYSRGGVFMRVLCNGKTLLKQYEAGAWSADKFAIIISTIK